MRGQPADRALFFPCFGPWPATLERHDAGSMPELLSFPLSRRGDWEGIKGRFDPAAPGRLPPNDHWQAFCRQAPVDLFFV